MRSTQFMGLSEAAAEFIGEHIIRDIEVHQGCPTCGNVNYEHRTERQREEDTGKNVTGMFGEEVHELKRYYLLDGRVVEEFIQAEPWSSGPVIFLALKDTKTGEVLYPWPQKEIENC